MKKQNGVFGKKMTDVWLNPSNRCKFVGVKLQNSSFLIASAIVQYNQNFI